MNVDSGVEELHREDSSGGEFGLNVMGFTK
jgi:hypothetical protein